MEEGDCVLFKNTRIVHSRTAFDTTQGKRWLRGAYLDEQELRSRSMGLDSIMSAMRAAEADAQRGV